MTHKKAYHLEAVASSKIIPVGNNKKGDLDDDLHCLELDGIYRIQNGVPEFHSVRMPTDEQLRNLLYQSINRVMKVLTHHGALIEEEG